MKKQTNSNYKTTHGGFKLDKKYGSYFKVQGQEWNIRNAISAPFPGKEWLTTIQALASGDLEVQSMISHRLDLSAGPKIFEKMTSHRDKNYGKVMFKL